MKAASLLVALALGGCLAPAQMLQQAALPETAPSFTAYTPEGEAWSLSAQRGKTILIDVMGVTCSACILQAPLLQDVAQRHANDSFAMISIDMGSAFPGWGAEDQEALLEYRAEHNLTWPIASDPEGSILRDYRILVLPTLIVIRPDGTIHKTLLGERSIEEIHDAVHGASLPR